jgi:hypothetical protein
MTGVDIRLKMTFDKNNTNGQYSPFTEKFVKKIKARD